MTTTLITDTQALIARATSITVSNPPTRQDAATLWSLIRTARKTTEVQQSMVCDPLKAAYEAARQPYLELRKECEAWESRLQAAMAAFDMEQDRLARVEQARLQAIVDRANAKIEAKAEAKGEEAVLRVAPVVPMPPKSMATQAGTTQGRTTKTVYGIVGAAQNEDMNMTDPRVLALVAAWPSLFELNWVLFRKIASTGMLDQVVSVMKRAESVYTQRAGT